MRMRESHVFVSRWLKVALMLKAPSISIITTKKTELAPSSRFVVASDADVIKAAEGVDPENTSRVNAWGLRNFDKWIMETGKATSSERYQETYFTIMIL